MKTLIKFHPRLNFGIEYEFTGTDTDQIKRVVNQHFPDEPTIVTDWANSDGREWHCKPDSTCGRELASRILKNPADLKLAIDILAKLYEDRIGIGQKCGCHVHIDVSGFTQTQVKILVAWWVKVERVFLNASPSHRRNNVYSNSLARAVGDRIRANSDYDLDRLWGIASDERFQSINLRKYRNCRTIEFRFGDMSRNLFHMKNRIRALLWFVSIVKNLPKPENLNWTSPKNFLQMMMLVDAPGKVLSPALLEMREWILSALGEYIPIGYYSRDKEEVDGLLAQIKS